MFKKLVEDRCEQVAFRFEGRELMADAGTTVAAALLYAGETHLRTTSRGVLRGPYCMMGACYECLVTVDGVNRQACQIVVQQGMEITRMQNLVGGTAVASAHE